MYDSHNRLQQLFGLEGKVAIITGAASGIGKATAHLTAEVGAKVVVVDLDPAGADAVASDITAQGGTAIAVACDVSEESQVQSAVKQTIDSFGGVDVLINNAAYRPKADFFEMDVATWDKMHAVNTRGTFLFSREVIKVMLAQGKERGGSIVNISTIGTAHPTIFNNVHYDSSKAGVNGITQSTAAEFAHCGIRINAVMPGGVDTEGSRRMRSEQATGFVPKGPITMPGRLLLGAAQPLELASAILFLSSPASSYMTGHIMAVDGGYLVG